MKTNGARFLENLDIEFELQEYEVDPNDLTAISVAKKIGMPPEQVFKTLIVTGVPASGGIAHVFAVIPGDAELDFKKLARAAGLRKAEMVPLKDVQTLTGYIRGGVTVFGAKKAFPVFVDETAILFDRISVSAGTRGTQLILNPEDYLRAAEAQAADLTKNQAVSIPSDQTFRAPSSRLFSGAKVGNHEADESTTGTTEARP
jgi:Cys-tRNA(Pro)/Cys-tRNA(Cys) deacylase